MISIPNIKKFEGMNTPNYTHVLFLALCLEIALRVSGDYLGCQRSNPGLPHALPIVQSLSPSKYSWYKKFYSIKKKTWVNEEYKLVFVGKTPEDIINEDLHSL